MVRLAKDLREAGARVFYDEWSLRPGDRLRDKISREIQLCAYFVVVLSVRSVRSRWVQRELDEAMLREINGKGPIIIPVLIGRIRTQIVPSDLQGLVWVDLRNRGGNRYRDGLRNLLRTMKLSVDFAGTRLGSQELIEMLQSTTAGSGTSLPTGRAEHLAKGLTSPSPEDRRHSIQELGRVARRSRHLIPVLVWALGDADTEVRLSAVSTLAATGDLENQMPHTLLGLLNDEVSVCLATLKALGKCSQLPIAVLDRYVSFLTTDDERREVVLGALSNRRLFTLDLLVRIADKSRWTGRAELASVIATHGRRATAPLARMLADDRSARVRCAASRALRDLGVRAGPAVPALGRALRDREPVVRAAAADTLRSVGSEAIKAIEPLIVALAVAEEPFRRHAVDALGNIGPLARDAVRPIARILRGEHGDASPQLRASAIVALSHIGPKSKVGPIIHRALGDPNPSVRRIAEDVYRNLPRLLETP